MAVLRFRSLSARLAASYTALFGIAMVFLATTLYFVTETIASHEVEQQMSASAATYQGLWDERTRHMQGAAGLLSRDFGFREAVATGDSATAYSALENLRSRLDLRTAFILGVDGKPLVGDDVPNAHEAEELWAAFDEGRLTGIGMVAGKPRQLAAAPITAPQLIGWIVFATDLDQNQLNALEALSPIPITSGIVLQSGADGWQRMAGKFPDFDSEQAKVIADAASGRSFNRITLADEPSYFDVTVLPTLGEGRKVALLLLYPRDRALAAFRPIQWSIALIALIGLLLMLRQSRRIAERITRPVALLDEAAAALARGTRQELLIEGDDELARLAMRFNEMARTIEERETHISRLAYSDVLTGLPNRLRFKEVAEAMLSEAREAGLALLCLDLDDFKSVNDTMGHSAGDVLLQRVAGRIGQQAGGHFVARLGGDEFVILLPFTDGDAELKQRARKLIDAIRRPLMIEGNQVVPGTSIGIAIAGEDGRDADTLLRHADLALYRAKAAGRGRYCFFEASFNERAQQRLKMEADMRRAIEQGEFELYYQPLFDLSTNQVCAAEALIRWNHPERGQVSPAEFIPLAEETGMILPIGAWVMREACREAASWPEQIKVAVNVSSIQFQREGLATLVAQALAVSGLAPHRLEVEITESIFLETNDATLDLLHKLKALGVRIALDDFGTGYSSLGYLQTFPFDKIKIDQSFIRQLLIRKDAVAVVRAITDLAAALGMETTAEGVEETAQLESLRDQGCTSVQGFLFSRPLTAGAIAALFRSSVSMVA